MIKIDSLFNNQWFTTSPNSNSFTALLSFTHCALIWEELANALWPCQHFSLCMCHLHMTEGPDTYLCISLESSWWKRLWRIPKNEYSCQLVPEENLQASSLHCQSLVWKPYGKNILIFNQTAGFESICAQGRLVWMGQWGWTFSYLWQQIWKYCH